MAHASASPLPCVVMIPGTLCDARLYAYQRRALRGHARVMHADLHVMRDVDTWMESLLADLPPRFSLVGFSLGGLLALEILRRAPERVERLAMVASNASSGSATTRRRSAALKRRFKESGPIAVVKPLLPAYFHHTAQRRLHTDLLQNMAASTPGTAAFEAFRWAAERPSGLQAFRGFTGPVLIVSGAQDRVCRLPLQQVLRNAQPGAVYREIPRCGHFVPLEAKAALSRALLAWTAELA